MGDQSTTIMIFGASGDLTHRKLIPSLYRLYCRGHLVDCAHIIGVSRSDLTDDGFRDSLLESAREFAADVYSEDSWASFSQLLGYISADSAASEDYPKIKQYLKDVEASQVNRLYHLAVPPGLYEPIVEALGSAGMAEEETGWRRIVVEKPFGNDLESAHQLNDTLRRFFVESQIYRIDHYLGKETAQNITFFRFANTLFEQVWDRNYIQNVQITVAESVDVGQRAGYYDKSGVLRDMFQNHLLQLLCLIAMEPATSMKADAMRNEKVKVLEAVTPIELDNTVRAQYRGYHQADGVDPNSLTPTYAALKLYIDTWRWQGVPFYLRSGKALKAKHSEIIVELKRPPSVMFKLPHDTFEPNLLSLCIQPDEGIHFRFLAKVPNTVDKVRSVSMEFHYDNTFGKQAIPDAYDRLLLDALKGDAGLFTRSDAIEAAWRIMDPIIQAWERDEGPPMVTYEPNTWGPQEADELLKRDDNTWRLGCLHQEEDNHQHD